MGLISLSEKVNRWYVNPSFVFGLMMIFLILSAQYEKWSLPILVILSVPFAVLGVLLLTWMRGISHDLYFHVGLVALIGLMAKSAFLIVEFALTYAQAANVLALFKGWK